MNTVTENKHAALARKENLVVKEMPEEVLVYDLRRHKAHCLNQTAAFVWNHCDGRTTTAEIASLMETEGGKPVGEDVVWLALKQLGKANLLQESVVKPAGGMRFSRREAIRRLGTAAAITLPLVTSVIAPMAAAAATIPAACQTCIKNNSDCPPACDGNVKGRCKGNAGCGVGNDEGCTTCAACLAGLGARSWIAPGSPVC